MSNNLQPIQSATVSTKAVSPQARSATVSPQDSLLSHHKIRYCLKTRSATVSPQDPLLSHHKIRYCLTTRFATASPLAFRNLTLKGGVIHSLTTCVSLPHLERWGNT